MGAFSPRARATFNQNLDKVYELFPRLKERASQKAGTLSGGEQQMVAVGRGLMAEPEVLMLDELSLGLSPLLALTLFEALTRLKKTGLTMLLVEQNVTMALAVSDYAYVLAEGRVHLEGPARDLAKTTKSAAPIWEFSFRLSVFSCRGGSRTAPFFSRTPRRAVAALVS